MLILLAAALVSSPTPTTIQLNMSTQCGRAADYRDEKTLKTARKLVTQARAENRSVRVELVGGGTLLGYYGTNGEGIAYSIPVSWKSC